MPETQGRIVVLGATGFVGSHVVARAKNAGWDVVALASSDIDLADPGSSQALAAVLKADDTVVHAAAVVPSKSAVDVSRNLLMTQTLVDLYAKVRSK